MSPTSDRLRKQAVRFDRFDGMFIYDETCFDHEFLSAFSSILNSKVRGYGYWIWKPYSILKALNSMDEGDILLYLDAGSHLNPNGKKRFEEYIELVKTNKRGLLTFEIDGGPMFTEKYWTKGDLFDFFNVRNDARVTDTSMRNAAVIFMKKTSYSVEFIEKWLSVFKTNLALADDSPSISDNFEGFRDHRFDQSIYSIMSKMEGLDSISSREISTTDWGSMDEYPIWEKKDKKIKLRYRYSLIRFMRKIFKL